MSEPIKSRDFVGVVLVADVPDRNHNVFSRDVLEKIATEFPDKYYIDGDKLMTIVQAKTE